MSENAYRDENDVPTLIASSNVDGQTPVRVYADPITHRLLVDTGGSVSAITSINADTTSAQTLTVGTTGTDFAIVDNGSGDHKFNLPTASAANRGALSSADWTTFNNKGTGSVTTVSVASANGFAGTVANATTTPAITLSTSVTGIIKGDGTAMSAATPGTDYTQGVMTTLGDIIYEDSTPTPKRLGGNTSVVMKFLAQTGNGTISAAPSWQTAPTTGNLVYYLTDTASSVATYLQQTIAPYSPKTTITITGVNSTSVIQNFATNAGVPGITFIPAGIYTFHIHASSTNPVSVNLYAEFWEVSSTGVDIGLIGTSETTAIEGGMTTSEVEYILTFSTANVYTMGSSASRVVCRVWALRTSATHDISLYVGGEADSHIALPSNTVDATNFVPYSGATTNVDLGAHTLTGTQLVSTIAIGTAPLVVTSTTPVANLSIGGNAGTVSNATLTTALTVNTGTVTLVGNAANTSALTIGAGAVSVSGSNTGDQTNISGNAATSTTTSGLTTATTTVVIGGATAPSLGQVLTASSSTAATWVTPTGSTKFSTTQVFSGTSPVTNFADLDLSSVIGVNQKVVMLAVTGDGSTRTFAFQRKGTSYALPTPGSAAFGVTMLQTSGHSPGFTGMVIVTTDTNGVIQWVSSAAVTISINVEAYW